MPPHYNPKQLRFYLPDSADSEDDQNLGVTLQQSSPNPRSRSASPVKSSPKAARVPPRPFMPSDFDAHGNGPEEVPGVYSLHSQSYTY